VADRKSHLATDELAFRPSGGLSPWPRRGTRPCMSYRSQKALYNENKKVLDAIGLAKELNM
jgi:hypothetical protein